MRGFRKRIIICILCAVLLIPSAGVCGINETVRAASLSRKTKKKKNLKTKKIELNKEVETVRVNHACKLKVKNTSHSVKWSCSNKKAVRIVAFGAYKKILRVYGKEAGTAVITAKVGDKKLHCTILVTGSGDKNAGSAGWHNGTWSDDGYRNGSGTVLADYKSVLSEPVVARLSLKKYPYLYVGASRTKNTAKAVKDKKVYFYHCGGAGFSWFFKPITKSRKKVTPVLSVIRSYLAQRPAGTVIIDLGGNDTSNVEAYIGFYRCLEELYPSAKFRFMGILPRAKGDPTNSSRKAFNKRLAEAFPGQVIDLYNKVYHMHDFKTVDGVHYGKKLSRQIYKLAMEKLGRRVKVNMKTGKVTG